VNTVTLTVIYTVIGGALPHFLLLDDPFSKHEPCYTEILLSCNDDEPHYDIIAASHPLLIKRLHVQ